MVDQAHVENREPRNGSAETPPAAVARNASEFMHDVISLAELQGRLFAVDLEDGVGRMKIAALVLAAGLGLAVSCLPIAMTVLALALYEGARMTLTQAFLWSLLAGAVPAAILIGVGVWLAQKCMTMLDRSRAELNQNVEWVKRMLKRMGKPADRTSQRSSFRY